MSLSGTELQALAGRLQTGIQAAAARNDTALLRAVLREALAVLAAERCDGARTVKLLDVFARV